MKSSMSFSTGLLYSSIDKQSGNFFDIGVSCFHINQPKQSFLQDADQKLPMRIAAQLSFQKYISENCFIHLRGLYQNQSQVHYLLSGISVGRLINEESDDYVGVGCWYRTGDSYSPYLVFEFKNLQMGLTYDVVNNNVKQSARKINSMELSLQFKLGAQ